MSGETQAIGALAKRVGDLAKERDQLRIRLQRLLDTAPIVTSWDSPGHRERYVEARLDAYAILDAGSGPRTTSEE